MIFGRSFAYGVWLRETETFSFKLQLFTNNIVINRAFSGWGIQHMLFQLRKNDFSHSFSYLNNKISNDDIKIVIYVFIDDHVRRLYVPCSFFDDKFIFYKLNKSSELFEKNNLNYLYWYSYISRSLYRNYIDKKIINYDIDVQNFVLTHFLESNSLIKKNFPNAKFVIFVYDGDDKIKKIEKGLKNQDIEIIYLSELTPIDLKKQEYIVDFFNHPNSNVWDIIVPLLAKKLNL